MKIYEIIGVLCILSFVIGFALLAIVQQRHASRHGRYRNLLMNLDADNQKLLQIGIPLVGLGVLLLIIGNIMKPN